MEVKGKNEVKEDKGENEVMEGFERGREHVKELRVDRYDSVKESESAGFRGNSYLYVGLS
jgi:hypothetical protein